MDVHLEMGDSEKGDKRDLMEQNTRGNYRDEVLIFKETFSCAN